MKKPISLIFIMAAVLFSAFIARAVEEVPVPVSARLVANVDAIVPGESFKLGVLFNIEPHWHVYWKNSGDSGLPTKVRFELPKDFSEKALNWPLPKTFKTKGDIIDYGYEDELLLSSVILAPEDLKPGSEINIKAQVSWISCKEICIPGRASLTLSLPVSEKSETANAKIFSKWESKLPHSPKSGDSPFTIDISREEDGATEVISITLNHKQAISDIELYPNPGETLSLGSVDINTSNNKTDIVVKTVLPSQKKPKEENLELLIVYKDKSGAHKGLELFIPATK